MVETTSFPPDAQARMEMLEKSLRETISAPIGSDDADDQE